MKHECPFCQTRRASQNALRTIRRWGVYFRKSDGQTLTRFWCVSCRKTFSAATTSPLRHQKKRHFNRRVALQLTAGTSQREAARVLGLNKKTVVRKFRYLMSTAKTELREENLQLPKAREVEFDDLETFEHTKCKPLSVTLMVEYKSRRILGFEVSQMPANGRLALKARKKYGFRADHRGRGRKRLFSDMQGLVEVGAKIRSDSNPNYKSDVKTYFPQAIYETVLGGRSSTTGHGELKKQKFDPIFSLNHTCAMLRDHISRLVRRTWSTTKKADQLAGHIALYALEHNRRLATV